ncbi:energy transducer TonB [Lysobacter korlensis]|uniref:Energy transducer TonB n=1 Tax=Lysobacter korlensis TaxID=553636 RepID=A0ABV6RL79_9GAMM
MQSRTGDAPPPPASREPAARRLRRPLLWAAAAFALGIVLFLVMLMRKDDDDFFRAGQSAPEAETPEYAPLPTPLPGGSDSVGLSRPPADAPLEGDGSRLVETAPPPPPAVPRPAAPRATARSVVEPERIPEQSPAPRYPVRALRRGEQGVVNVRAEIGPDGVPTSVSLVGGSGSRDLDRAALDAVRRWRFRPAHENGRPTVGTIVVPIEFTRE